MSVSIQTPSFDAPVDVTRAPVEGSLAHHLATGTTTAALTFAGQGWRWWEDLARLLERRSWLRPRAARWAGVLAELSADGALRDLGGAASGFDPLAWIDAPASAPTDGELAALPLSMPGVLLTQLLAYREAWEDGLSRAVDAGSVVAATGHSGGLIAAAAVAAQPDGVEDEDVLTPYLRLAVVLGHVVGTSVHAVGPAVLDAALRGDAGAPTPMLAVAGIRLDRLHHLLESNAEHDEPNPVLIALHHGPARAVLSGTPAALADARRHIERELRGAPDGGQAMRVVWEPLAVSAPCHHPMLGDVARAVVDLAGAGGSIAVPDAGVALVSPSGPRLLASGQGHAGNGSAAPPDLTAELVAAMLTLPGRWDRTAASLVDGSTGARPAEWLLDLGPSDGIATLAAAAVRGTGARVLALAQEQARRHLVAPGAVASDGTTRYDAFAPSVVTLPGGTTRVENRFTRATGRSPIVLAGMTPTTVDAPIVAAAANAGHLAELAGGGQVTEAILTERLTELTELLEPGQEIVFNALHLDPYLWGLHLGRSRLVQAARRAGAPLCGVTVSAGIPALDDAVALLDELDALGMWCNAFKPGTVDQVRQVVAIAQAAPRHTVFVHVEGGTAGGHHSWVDLEDLLLAGYHELRGCDNVVLCAGGGVGTPERAAELLTGRWSLRHTGIAMPVDAVLLGTVAMAAAEATATHSVKRALSRADGRPPEGIDAGFVEPGRVVGAVTSGRSGLDADIHFLDNAASRCARLLDSVAGNADAVDARRDEIVTALAATAKPYFGDVDEMTYAQLLRRFAELTALGCHGRYEDGAWLDVSHRRRFLELLRRAEARLDPREQGEIVTCFADDASVDEPYAAIDRLLATHPDAADTVLHPADPGHFLGICRAPGKPVPFVPVIDADVRRWYQSDSLWQAQHPAYDADEVLVIPGPAAVGGIAVIDEPVAGLLGRFERHLHDELAPQAPARSVPRLRRGSGAAELTGPVAALLEAPVVVIGGRHVPNPLRAFGRPEQGALTVEGDRLLACELRIVRPSDGPGAQRVEQGPAATERVTLRAGTGDRADVATLTLRFPSLRGYDASASASPFETIELDVEHRTLSGVDVLVLDAEHRADQLAGLMQQTLLRGATDAVGLGTEVALELTADPDRRRAFGRLVGATDGTTDGTAPADSWLPTVWPAVFAALGAPEIVGNLLDLVHLEHRVTALDAAGTEVLAGTDLRVRAQVAAVTPHEAGTRVDTVAEVHGPDGAIVRIDGAFLLRDVRDLRVPDGLATAGLSTGSEPRAGSEPAESAPADRPRRTLGVRRRRAPASMAAFAAVSGDHNPIHRSVAVARFVGLDGPIVHGAWTSAVAQQVTTDIAAGGSADRLVDWHARFLAPVLPAEELEITVVRTAVRDGRILVEATGVVQRADGPVPVVTATAEIAPARTAYLFPGQGIQRPGMGMDGYERSAAARRVWDRADEHTRERLGFSILSIVRDNPTSVLADGEVHRHPAGVLHLTQFTQVAMAALASAQVAELREQGVFDDAAVCAGHSVGEYNALAAVGDVLALEVVVELVFRRGQAMHHLVPRDTAGNSDYRLGVVRPHLVDMDHAEVEELVTGIRDRLGQTLEIVNYNLRGKQYAVAGTLAALDALDQDLQRRSGPGGRPAFLYVPGIDVPFHSSVLRDGVADFRRHLDDGLPERIDPALLVGRYVPNLVPRRFTLAREYVTEVRDHVDSEHLTAILDDWASWQADPPRLCRELLVELLAWQFASPVRWIETQDLLIEEVDRIVEVGLGSQPTIANLARGTLALDDASRGNDPRKAGVIASRTVEVLNVEADRQVVFALDEDPEPEPLGDEAAATDGVAAAASAGEVLTAAAPIAASPTVEIADLPVGPGDGLRWLLAVLTKARPDQLAGSETIDDLVDGVSSRRNQVLMDLGAEFAVSSVDGARELPLDQLATEVAARAGRYRFPGPVLRDARDAALTPVLAGRRLKTRDVVARVTGHWGLGDGWAERVLTALAFDARDGDSARGGPLGRLHPLPTSGEDAIDTAVQLVAAEAGTALPTPGAAAGGGTVDAAAVQDLEARLAGPSGLLAGVARDLLGRVAPESVADVEEPGDTAAAERLLLLDAEHGDRRAAAVAPSFDPRRHVAFTSWWATARHDVVALHHAGLRGDDPASLEAEAARLSRHVVDPGVRAAAGWYAERARRRGDAAAAERFGVLLAGAGWTVPVPSVRPEVEHTGVGPEAVDVAAPELRLVQLVDRMGAAGDGWSAVYAAQLDALRGVSASASASAPSAAFADETAVVTGASPGSIAVEVVRQLLAGGATVMCTTTQDSPERLAFYRELYRTAAAPGAELHVVRANLASFADVDALVQWVVEPHTESAAGVTRTLKDPMRPTLVLPFAAGPVAGDLVDVGPDAEVAMRVLLWGVERLVGRLADAVADHGTGGRRVRVVLPLSPNHGGFGGDGAYGEAKAALEVLVEKWASEHQRWGGRIDLVAATIGWVRGTGLMDANDALAALAERDLGVRTFSAAEMGWLLAGLCTGRVAAAAGPGPLRVDLSGGLTEVGPLRQAVAPLVDELTRSAPSRGNDPREPGVIASREAVHVPALLSPDRGPVAPPVRSTEPVRTPTRPLDDMVVVVGAGELGPWGGSATRFDLEVDGELAAGSVVELAWTCGLIRWDAELDGGSWVDEASGDAVAEGELVERYRDEVDARCGIRTFEVDGPLDPDGVPLVVEVYLDDDAVVTVADEAEARAFAAADPANTTVRRGPEGDWQVVRRAGSSIRVPRRAALSRSVGGQIPSGFDPTRWGIPTEMAASVDRLSLWNLVATVEAFLDAGIEPEELMARVHPARVGNTQGSGMGGMTSIQTLYRDSVLGGDHANDLLQEGLGNVIAAYVVQSYVGSYGPMVHPVAACATAAVSIEDGVDKIRAGKADVIVAGGWDDLALEGVLGFGAMSATASTADMRAAGLQARQFSRSNDRRRAGFVEAQGGGTVLLARGSVAAELGLPVRGVVVYAGSFGDGIHTSIPAPGLGALACVLGGDRSPLALALEEHGLVPDDVAVVSKHDTSTGANDPNESELHQRIATALGRSPGNPLLVVSQKTVTGHAKGGAAAWQAIGLLQVLESGQVPGNRNLECLDPGHRDHTHLAYGHRTVRAGEPLRAGLLTSLGFGHVSAVLCLADASVFTAALDASAGPDAVAAHREAASERRRWGRRRRLEGRFGGRAAYTKRVDRRFEGDEQSDVRREAEATLLTDASVRLQPAGTYAVPTDPAAADEASRS